jgi:flagellar biosynthesis/type III secretory pathway M-ring protein FliF/YscJ
LSQYDGLNLPELLARMHDLVVPEPVPWLPQTPGWWIVLGWLVAVVLLAAWQIVRRRRRNRYRRDALAELKAIEIDSGTDTDKAAQRIAGVLKRTALVAYPRRDVAGLYGTAWARFLTESAGNDRQVADAAEELAAAAYRPGADPKVLNGPARRWIRRHRA